MFSYYGSKSKVINLYPSPQHDKIIEPFAGSARYALKYYDRDVLLVDKYEIIVRVWKYLQNAKPKDILSLPNLKAGETIIRESFECIELAWLFGFMVQAGVNAPRLTVSKFAQDHIPRQKKTIVSNLHKIKHWEILHGSFDNIENQEATWFIDPPYQFGGEYYIKSNKEIDYNILSDWCKSRNGHVIVCENTKADWLDFYPMKKMTGTIHTTTEAIWSNMPHNFMATQPPLFV